MKLCLMMFMFAMVDLAAAASDVCEHVKSEILQCNFIPENIPPGISKVKISGFKENKQTVEVNSSYFQTDNWGTVEHFELTANVSNDFSPTVLAAKCFEGLNRLRVLKLQSTNVEIHPDAFVGLTSVKSLDLSGCVRLALKNLISSLNGIDKLPGLEELKIANVNFFFSPPSAIDQSFTKALKSKNITHLDISGSKISNLDVAAIYEDFRHLKVLNASLASITGDFLGSSFSSKLDNQTFVEVADFSYIQTFWIYLYGKFAVYNQVYQSSELGEKFSLFASKVVNLSGCMGEHIEFWTFNVTVNITGPLPIRSQTVIVEQANFKRLDGTVHCKGFEATTARHLSVARNGLEFLHPSILSCMPNLTSLDLSHNQMFKMVDENSVLFEKLFVSLQHLKMIKLSKNNLKRIPKNLFNENQELEIIDLTYNELSQIKFTLSKLSKMKVLNLQHNKIMILDEFSRSNLNSIPGPTNQNITPPTVTMTFNPMQCSRCESEQFIHWLTQTRLVSVSDHTCINENGDEQNIDAYTIKEVQYICRRKMIIISTSVSVTLFVIICSVLITALYKHHKRKMLRANRAKAKQLLRKGRGQYEFAVFLSFTSLDDEFVAQHVLNNLNKNLKLITGLERDLVCTGDENYRPGHTIFDETGNILERASVVIAVVSDDYCQRLHCRNEVDEAYKLKKPIILMLKGRVNEQNMMPTMKLLFKKNVRVLWCLENGEYVLKSTWENVCMSILDLISPEEKPDKNNEENKERIDNVL